MKKYAALLLCALLTLFPLSACGQSTTVGGFASAYLNEEDYEAAVEEVMLQFNDEGGWTMNKIEYVGDEANTAEAEARDLAPEQVIVLRSSFQTSDSAQETDSLEPNRSYENYLWVLTRYTTGEPWVVTERGK